MFDKGSLAKNGSGGWGPGVCCCLNLTLVICQSPQGTGDRTTLPLRVLTSKRYMLMETWRAASKVSSGRVMVGLPSEAAASSLCSWIPFSEMIWLSLSRTTKCWSLICPLQEKGAVVWTCLVIGCRGWESIWLSLVTHPPHMVRKRNKITSGTPSPQHTQPFPSVRASARCFTGLFSFPQKY